MSKKVFAKLIIVYILLSFILPGVFLRLKIFYPVLLLLSLIGVYWEVPRKIIFSVISVFITMLLIYLRAIPSLYENNFVKQLPFGISVPLAFIFIFLVLMFIFKAIFYLSGKIFKEPVKV